MIEVTFETVVEHPDLRRLIDKAQDFYDENNTRYKLYTNPKTVEDAVGHNKYAALCQAVDNWKDQHPEHCKGLRVVGRGILVQVLNANDCIVADMQTGEFYPTALSQIRYANLSPDVNTKETIWQTPGPDRVRTEFDELLGPSEEDLDVPLDEATFEEDSPPTPEVPTEPSGTSTPQTFPEPNEDRQLPEDQTLSPAAAKALGQGAGSGFQSLIKKLHTET